MKRRNRRPAATLKRYNRIRFHAPGVPPGSLQRDEREAGPPAPPARMSLIRYNEAGIEEKVVTSLAELSVPGEDAGKLSWLHFQSPPTAEQLERLRTLYGLHPLALEDVFNEEHRPKFESYEAQYFVVLNHLRRTENDELCTDQVSFFLGKNYVISIDEGPTDCFEPVRQRLRAKRVMLARGADYLLYALIDVVIDGGFPLLETLGERLESLENQILDNPTHKSRNQIHYVKRELITMRRALWPQREVISSLIRDGDQFLTENTRVYLRDCYDHSVIVMDFLETYREMASNLLDTYLSSVSQRMNDVMKALTIIATIFLPLSFVAGLYGMNFSPDASHWNMPELHWRYGYFYALGVMLAIIVGMLAWFRHKRWW